ncbi:MAG: hypothetical protein M0Z41_00240, partial [Peptococcaceae bacterium]|nr:hypothetical protein [Peptococcaceae bacterium]
SVLGNTGLSGDAGGCAHRGPGGRGESAVIPNAPPIRNAIHDVVGIRVKQLPAPPARVLSLLRERERKGLGGGDGR